MDATSAGAVQEENLEQEPSIESVSPIAAKPDDKVVLTSPHALPESDASLISASSSSSPSSSHSASVLVNHSVQRSQPFQGVAFPHTPTILSSQAVQSSQGQSAFSSQAVANSQQQSILSTKKAKKSAAKQKLGNATAEKLERARERRASAALLVKSTPTPGVPSSQDLVEPPSQHGPVLTQASPTPVVKTKKSRRKEVKDSQ